MAGRKKWHVTISPTQPPFEFERFELWAYNPEAAATEAAAQYRVATKEPRDIGALHVILLSEG